MRYVRAEERIVQLLLLTTYLCLDVTSAVSVLQPHADNINNKNSNVVRSFHTSESGAREIDKRGKSGEGSSQGKCTCTCETKLVKETAKEGNSVVEETDPQPGKTHGGNVEGQNLIHEPSADEPGSQGDSDRSDAISDLQSSDLDRYSSNYGHGSRYPWKRLPDTMCLREPCKSDKDCCRRYNICDRSASVCRDCWYGDECRSESDCCSKYPLCLRSKDETKAKCVEKD